LPVLHEVPAFELTSHRGEAVTREDMLGRVWVADFFLTRCTGVCPVLASQMGLVQERLAEAGLLGDEVGLMSFNVDGDHDDVERVADWAAGHEVGADWHVVTGPRAEVWPMVREGFMMYVGQSQGDETTPVAHSSQLVVIDRAGRVRAHVSGLLPDTPEQVMAVVEALVEEG
jgi:protein SCO1/2